MSQLDNQVTKINVVEDIQTLAEQTLVENSGWGIIMATYGKKLEASNKQLLYTW